eukprot:GHVQ01033703.1.p1 GENE.GHVQ01033703.1~~GHVQ01033703.1.p1  ORF type:complete len:315 (-),score=92.66 GHVQ01033703.1:244-1188(-)
MSTTNPSNVLTEWDEQQIKYGNLPAPEQQPTEIALSNEAIDFVVSAANQHSRNITLNKSRLKTHDMTNREDGQEETREFVEDRDLEDYRRMRIRELKQLAHTSRYGYVCHLGKDEFITHVTEESKRSNDYNDNNDSTGNSGGCLTGNMSSGSSSGSSGSGTSVVVLLYDDTIECCNIFINIFNILAKKYGYVKFVKAVARDVLPQYPMEQTPTVLVYRNGVCKHQIVGADKWLGRGVKRVTEITAESVEWMLRHTYKVFSKQGRGGGGGGGGGEGGGSNYEDEDDEEEAEEKEEQQRDRCYADMALDKIVNRCM